MVSFILGICVCFCFFQWVDCWPESVEKIIDPRPLKEASLLRFVNQNLEF